MGVLIAVYPQLLSLIIAWVLIVAGAGIVSVSYRYKKLKKHLSDPFFDFFIRF